VSLFSVLNLFVCHIIHYSQVFNSFSLFSSFSLFQLLIYLCAIAEFNLGGVDIRVHVISEIVSHGPFFCFNIVEKHHIISLLSYNSLLIVCTLAFLMHDGNLSTDVACLFH